MDKESMAETGKEDLLVDPSAFLFHSAKFHFYYTKLKFSTTVTLSTSKIFDFDTKFLCI